MDRLYVLTRTSGRPKFFERCRRSVSALTWPGGVTHIVHSDDPRNERYIEADILIRGEAHGPYMGGAPYNLYNNRLIKAIPGPGWVHFIDDDDEYVAPDVFERLLEDGRKDRIHIGRVSRGGDIVWPQSWKNQKSFQTECFCMWSDIAKKGKWWADKGGDHHYTRQLTKRYSLTWVDMMLVQAQNGKSHGALIDLDGSEMDRDTYRPDEEVLVKMFVDKNGRRAAKVNRMPYKEAAVFERHGYGRITYKGTEICSDFMGCKSMTTA